LNRAIPSICSSVAEAYRNGTLRGPQLLRGATRLQRR